MMETIFGLIATFGYGVVFLVVMAESAGLPVPGETSLLIASALAATGKLNIVGVIAAAAAGAIAGDTGGYWVGRTYGVALLRRYGRLFRFDEEKLAKAEAFFAKHGEKTVFFGRFVPVGRIFSAVLAGVGRMHYPRFLAWNATGGICWAALMGTLGYLFGHNLPLIEKIVERGGFALLAAIILAVAGRYAYAHRAALRSRLSGWRPARWLAAAVGRGAPRRAAGARPPLSLRVLLGGGIVVAIVGLAGLLILSLT